MLRPGGGTRVIVAVFRHHPIQLMATVLWGACLILLTIAAQAIHPALGAATILVIIWLVWRLICWHAKTYSFTQDGRLVCKQRLFGVCDNVVNLFGQVRVRQSLLGRLFDYGDVDIFLPGESVRLRCIGNFSDLMRFLEGGVPLWYGSSVR